eukprot:1248166-Amphidinium_carterae.2
MVGWLGMYRTLSCGQGSCMPILSRCLLHPTLKVDRVRASAAKRRQRVAVAGLARALTYSEVLSA